MVILYTSPWLELAGGHDAQGNPLLEYVGPNKDLVDGYRAARQTALDTFDRYGASGQYRTGAEVSAVPDVAAAYADANRRYAALDALAGEAQRRFRQDPVTAQNWGTLFGPRNAYLHPLSLSSHDGKGGLGGFLKSVAPLALGVLAPGLGTGLGTALGLGSGTLASAVGGGLLGAGTGALAGGGVKGTLLGGLTGAAGGYLSNGGFSEAKNALGVGDPFGSASPLPWQAGGTTGASLPWQTAASGGGSAAGGGGAISFGPSAANTALPWQTPGLFDDPLGYLGNQVTDGVEDMLSPESLLKSGLKFGLSSALQRDNTAGFNALQAAANASAEDFRPFLQSGTAANGQLAGLLGLSGPQGARTAMQGFQAAPGYQFALNQGIDALDASAARRGLLLSGNNQRAVQDYGTGLANQYFQQYLDNLARTSGQGQQAAQQVGQAQADAAAAFAALKGAKANNSNQLYAGLLDALF